MVNWLIFCSFVLSMALTILGLMVDVSYQIRISPQVESLRNRQKTQFPDFQTTEAAYLTHPVFRPRTPQTKDFAELIGQIRKGDLQEPLIDPKLKKQVFSLGDQWLDRKHKISKHENVELLFAKIGEYDHWALPRHPDDGLATDLIVASQLFLAWTFHYQPTSSREALQKARMLSEILLQTQDLNFKRAGLSILEKENDYVEVLSTRIRNSKLLWTPVTQKELKHYRDHLSTTASYLSPLTPPELFEKIFLSEEKPMGMCALYKSKYKLLSWSENFLQPQFPLEPKFKKTIKNLRALRGQMDGHCTNWKTPQDTPTHWFRNIPFYRRIYGVKMILDAEENKRVL